MTDSEQRKPGRPRKHEEPREEVRIRLPVALIAALDAVTHNRTAYIEQALRERPEITARLHER